MISQLRNGASNISDFSNCVENTFKMYAVVVFPKCAKLCNAVSYDKSMALGKRNWLC